MNEEKTKQEIHIGSLIKAKVMEQNFSEAELSKMLHCHPSNVYDMYKRKCINTDLLWKFSIILKYNFFTEIYGATLDNGYISPQDNGTTTLIISPEKIFVERNNGLARVYEYRKVT